MEESSIYVESNKQLTGCRPTGDKATNDFKISAIARLLYNTKVKLHVVVVLFLVFLSSRVRVAVVSACSFSSLSSLFSHYIIYQQSPTHIFFFILHSSPPLSRSLLTVVTSPQFHSSSPHFFIHFLGICCLPVFYLTFLSHMTEQFQSNLCQFLLKTVHHSNLHSQFVLSSLILSLLSHDSSYPVVFANLPYHPLFLCVNAIECRPYMYARVT